MFGRRLKEQKLHYNDGMLSGCDNVKKKQKNSIIGNNWSENGENGRVKECMMM